MVQRAWYGELSEEDFTFIKRFILASGSLKEIAKQYGITYPTVRIRLDRLIEKIKVLDREDISDEFERILRARYAEGRVDKSSFKALLSAHRKEIEKQHKGEPS